MTPLLDEIATLGWLVNNCYQVDVSLWRVSLRKPTEDGSWFSSWAEGPTFEEALEDCVAKLAEATYEEDKLQSYTQANEPAKVQGSLLLALGLRKPIRRRA